MARPRPKEQFAGPPGETVFYRKLASIEWEEEWNQEVPALFARLERAGDDRSLVLFSALLVEAQLDALLAIWIPRYKVKLQESLSFTFSMKLELLDAMRLIPRIIVRCADVVRDVRNKFAHKLECDRLEEMKEKWPDLCARVKAAYDDDYPHHVPFPQPPSSDLRAQFDYVAFTAICGLRTYRVNLAALREKIDSEEFIASLAAPIEQKFQRDVEEATLRNLRRVANIAETYEREAIATLVRHGYAHRCDLHELYLDSLAGEPATDEEQLPAMIEELRAAGFTGSNADAALVLHTVLNEMPRECVQCSKNRDS